jgi:hypothetical protein
MRVVLCLLGLMLSTTADAGTFFNPTGDPKIAETGATAAAELNEALSALHLMYAAVERKDGAALQKNRESAVKFLGSATERFRSIESQMPNREVKLNPKTDAEKETIETFRRYTLGVYGLKEPKTERELVRVAVVIADALRKRLEKDDIKPGNTDWRPVREVIRMQLDLAGAGLAVSLIFAAPK